MVTSHLEKNNLTVSVYFIRKSLPSEDHNHLNHVVIVDANQLFPLDQLISQDQLTSDHAANMSVGNPPVLLNESELDHNLSLIPVIACILLSFSYGCGLGPIPYVLFGELFPG